MTTKTPTAVSAAAAALGSIGGKTTGPTKARTTEQARAAGIKGAQKRWAKHKSAQKPRPKRKGKKTMKTVYTLHHSINKEEDFPNLKELRKFVRNPHNEHLIWGAYADKRTIEGGESSEPERVDLAKLTV